MDKQRTIWCLFSIANLYEQPGHNLQAWWMNKPTFDELIDGMGMNHIKSNNEVTSAAKRILEGDEIRVWETSYRLEEVSEGRVEQRSWL